jgi:biofilm protein TabA
MAGSSVALICIDNLDPSIYILSYVSIAGESNPGNAFISPETAPGCSLFVAGSFSTIASDLKHIDCQLANSPSLQKALDFLRLRGIRDLPDGKVEIDGQKVYAIVQRYQTTDTGPPKFEYHKKYIDIQFIASGKEVIGWAPAESMTITEAYDADKDIAFGAVETGKWTPLALQAGQLVVLYPEDGHAPRLALGEASAVMKIVVKVEV